MPDEKNGLPVKHKRVLEYETTIEEVREGLYNIIQSVSDGTCKHEVIGQAEGLLGRLEGLEDRIIDDVAAYITKRAVDLAESKIILPLVG